MLTIEQVQSVYSGKSGACCCGCAGKHTYRQVLLLRGKEVRGYELFTDECNDSVVKRHLNTINKAIEAGEDVQVDDDYVAYDNGKRIYVAYFLKMDKLGGVL